MLGYVYLTPAADRLPVYRVANPNGGGGFRNADWVVPLYREANSAEYVTDTAARDALLAKGWRDDGIAFYAANAATRPSTASSTRPAPTGRGTTSVFFFTDGPEHDARAAQPASEIADLGAAVHHPRHAGAGQRRAPPGHVPGSFDVLAAGDARFDQVLHQGNRPVWALAWPGLTQPTRFIIEALDAGCPFPGGYISYAHHDADVDRTSNQPFNQPSLTVDEARLSSGEVFINGQHDPSSRPEADRARLRRRDAGGPPRRWTSSRRFDDGESLGAVHRSVGQQRRRIIAIEVGGGLQRLHRQPHVRADAGAADARLRRRRLELQHEHVAQERADEARRRPASSTCSMSTDIPSTGRRYPQIMITNVPLA